MLKLLPWIATGLCLAVTPAVTLANQDSGGTYLVTSQSRQRSAPPVIGLSRQADFIVMEVSFASDSRDGLVRRQEIHAMLRDALGKADSAGLALSTGSPVLIPLTRENYQDINFTWAGREDTSKADVMVSVPLNGTAADAEKRIDAFVKSLTRQGRGTIYKSGGRLLGVRNPEQYRAQIVGLIADEVRGAAETFGPDYRAEIEGIDQPVQWQQRGDSNVFLYLPYSYRIVAR